MKFRMRKLLIMLKNYDERYLHEYHHGQFGIYQGNEKGKVKKFFKIIFIGGIND